jgi:hypothetical protein
LDWIPFNARVWYPNEVAMVDKLIRTIIERNITTFTEEQVHYFSWWLRSNEGTHPAELLRPLVYDTAVLRAFLQAQDATENERIIFKTYNKGLWLVKIINDPSCPCTASVSERYQPMPEKQPRETRLEPAKLADMAALHREWHEQEELEVIKALHHR